MDYDINEQESKLEWIKKQMRKNCEEFPILLTYGSRRVVVERFVEAKKMVTRNLRDWKSFKEMWRYSLQRYP